MLPGSRELTAYRVPVTQPEATCGLHVTQAAGNWELEEKEPAIKGSGYRQPIDGVFLGIARNCPVLGMDGFGEFTIYNLG